MSNSDPKKRPPPIAIPEWPPSRATPAHTASGNPSFYTKGSGQHPQRLTSSSTQQALCSGVTTPLTSPLEPDEVRLAVPKSSSQASRHRSSAMTTLSGLMDQARTSPRKTDCGSLPSRHGSTTRSRQSERSHRSAVAAQAQLEALDEDETTTRSQIESRTEQKLFKLTGQIPPTPATGIEYSAHLITLSEADKRKVLSTMKGSSSGQKICALNVGLLVVRSILRATSLQKVPRRSFSALVFLCSVGQQQVMRHQQCRQRRLRSWVQHLHEDLAELSRAPSSQLVFSRLLQRFHDQTQRSLYPPRYTVILHLRKLTTALLHAVNVQLGVDHQKRKTHLHRSRIR